MITRKFTPAEQLTLDEILESMRWKSEFDRFEIVLGMVVRLEAANIELQNRVGALEVIPPDEPA